MLIDTIKEGNITVTHLSCDQCKKVFARPGKKYATRIRHFCSRSCSIESQRSGVLLEDFKEKCRQKFGCEYPMQSRVVREKSRETCLERYGSISPGTVALKNYAKNAGVSNISQLADVKSKIRATSLKKYGSENFFASEHAKNKIRQTNLSKYGTATFFETEEFKEKSRKTHLNRRSVDHHMKSEHVKSMIDWHESAKKRHDTMKKNGAYTSSKAEDRFYQFLCETFGKDEVTRHVTIESSSIDFYVKMYDVYIQFDGVYWHGLDRNISEIAQFKNPRDRIIFDTVKRDDRQIKTFEASKRRLVRVSDKEFDVALRNSAKMTSIMKTIKGIGIIKWE
jgi:hypothetical protein